MSDGTPTVMPDMAQVKHKKKDKKHKHKKSAFQMAAPNNSTANGHGNVNISGNNGSIGNVNSQVQVGAAADDSSSDESS